MTVTKSGLAILLSRLKSFSDPSRGQEQYPTPSEIAAEVLWLASMQGDIAAKRVADLGCGTGILSLGAALLDAASVFGVDTDEKAITVAKENLAFLEDQTDISLAGRVSFRQEDIAQLSERVDTVVQNPPFGTGVRHADRAFLAKACAIADVVWTFHKENTAVFVERFAQDAGFHVTHRLVFAFPLKASMAHHRSRIRRIEVGCWRLARRHV